MSATATPSASGAAGTLRRVGQIAIVCEDVARATRFYRDTLGLPLLFEAPPGLAFFDCGGVRLMLSRPEGEGGTAGASSIVYYAVDDIQAAYARLQAAGVAFDGEPHVVARLGEVAVWMAFLRDSEGNVVGVMEERRGGAGEA